ncbi:MAG: ChaN family lipoprotein [Bacteroidetes bacterium]|nr:ChaN family lipoprotein [Bacteroidota bacterium]
MKFYRTILFVSLLILSISAFSQSPVHYKIYSVREGKEISLSDITDAMKTDDVLFFGEEHNDSVTHSLEAKILESLFTKYPNTTLSMEMFDRDVQTVMNEYLTGDIREKNFVKDARVWSNYKDYKPMIEFAKKNKMDVVCANAPSRYTNLVGRKGQKALMVLSADSKKNFAPLPFDTASGKYYEKLQEMSGHGPTNVADTAKKKMPPINMMGNFNLIMGQSLWDATMAYSISEYLKKNKGKKVLQVNGRFHSDEGFAVATQLLKYSPKLKVKIISSGTDETFPNIDWRKHQHLGDYIIITDPKLPRSYKD